MVTHGQDRRGFQSLCTYVAALMLASPACALSPDLRIKQFYHTAWTAKEGAPTDIADLAQTRDGYLWIASTAGMFRVHGGGFGRIDANHRTRLSSHNGPDPAAESRSRPFSLLCAS